MISGEVIKPGITRKEMEDGIEDLLTKFYTSTGMLITHINIDWFMMSGVANITNIRIKAK